MEAEGGRAFAGGCRQQGRGVMAQLVSILETRKDSRDGGGVGFSTPGMILALLNCAFEADEGGRFY